VNRGLPSAEWLEAGADAPPPAPPPEPGPVQLPSFTSAAVLSMSIGLALALVLDGLQFMERRTVAWRLDGGALLLPFVLWAIVPLSGHFPGFGPQLKPGRPGWKRRDFFRRGDGPVVLNAVMRCGAFLSAFALWGVIAEWEDARPSPGGLDAGPRWLFLTPLVLTAPGAPRPGALPSRRPLDALREAVIFSDAYPKCRCAIDIRRAAGAEALPVVW
jgi:hypothetical protein